MIHQDMLLRREGGVKKEGNIGVTAEIFSSKEEGDDFRYEMEILLDKVLRELGFEVILTKKRNI